MSRPPRNQELERLVIDVLRATPADAPDRHAAWEVYADWLLGLGEPVGEWLAASLRADDDGEAAAPIRAQLGDIERACRFRLVDLELADLSEVPELTRIAEFTWERGFITSAAFRCRTFRRFDSELLGHTPDRFLDVVLRSPSACVLHQLTIDVHAFEAEGSRWPHLSALLAALPDDLPLRELSLGARDALVELDGPGLSHLPALERLSVCAAELRARTRLSLARLERLELRVEPQPADPRARPRSLWGPQPQPQQPRLRTTTIDDILPLLDAVALPRCTELVLALDGIGEPLAAGLGASSLLAQLRVLRIEHVDEALALALVGQGPALRRLERCEIVGAKLPLPLGAQAALREIGCTIT